MPMVSPHIPPNIWRLIATMNDDNTHNERLMADIDEILAEPIEEDDE